MSQLIDRLRAAGADMDGALERLVGDEELFETCFQMFLEDPAFPELQAALDQADYTGAFNAAHTIKGVAGNLGLTAVFDAANGLVTPLRGGQPPEPEALPALHQALLSAMEAVRALA